MYCEHGRQRSICAACAPAADAAYRASTREGVPSDFGVGHTGRLPVSEEIRWTYRDGSEVEGSPTWEAIVNGIRLTVRTAVTPDGPVYWFVAHSPSAYDFSSLWAFASDYRTWPTVEEAQRHAIKFALKEAQ